MEIYSCFADEFLKTKIEKKFPIAVWRDVNNLKELNNNKTKKPSINMQCEQEYISSS